MVQLNRFSEPLNPLHVYRHLLREATYLPPPIRPFVWQQISTRFRRTRSRSISSPLHPRQERRRIYIAIGALWRIRGANAGEINRMRDLVNRTFGRRGVLRREFAYRFLLHPEKPRAPPSGPQESAQSTDPQVTTTIASAAASSEANSTTASTTTATATTTTPTSLDSSSSSQLLTGSEEHQGPVSPGRSTNEASAGPAIGLIGTGGPAIGFSHLEDHFSSDADCTEAYPKGDARSSQDATVSENLSNSTISKTEPEGGLATSPFLDSRQDLVDAYKNILESASFANQHDEPSKPSPNVPWLEKWDLDGLSRYAMSQKDQQGRKFHIHYPSLLISEKRPVFRGPTKLQDLDPKSRVKLASEASNTAHLTLPPLPPDQFAFLRFLAFDGWSKPEWRMPPRRTRVRPSPDDPPAWDWRRYATKSVRVIESDRAPRNLRMSGEGDIGPYGRGYRTARPRDYWMKRIYQSAFTASSVIERERDGSLAKITWGTRLVQPPRATQQHAILFRQLPPKTRVPGSKKLAKKITGEV